jgi:hypothetical protein
VSPPNKIDQLPPEILDVARGLLRDGRTVDEITSKLQELGAEVSRSGVGRWKKSAAKSMRSLQRAQAFGSEWAKSLKEDPEGKVGRLLVEMGKTAVLDTLLAAQEGEEDGEETQPLDVKSLFFLSSAVKNFESAGNMNVARELKIRDEVIAKERAAAVKAVEQVATEGGMSGDTLAKLRAAIIGKAA